MSLSALINGADCGPANPLQGLTKRFDTDRGISQDQFGSSRAGSSRETFRSAPTHASPAFAQEAAEFFQGNGTPRAIARAPFDLSSLNAALAANPEPSTVAHAPGSARQAGPSSWAADFSATVALKPALKSTAGWAGDFAKQVTPAPLAHTQVPQAAPVLHSNPHPMFQHPQFHLPPPTFAPMVQPMHTPQPQITHRSPDNHEANLNSSQWESQFNKFESQHEAITPELSADDLATTAGLLLESLKSEQNQKFKNSAFMGLMRQVRDHQVVVDGNDLVAASEVTPAPLFDTVADSVSRIAKGKMREIDPSSSSSTFQRRKSVHFEPNYVPVASDEDFQDWEQDAAESSTARTKARRVGIIEAQEAEWAQLQQDWDDWEATATGFQPVATAAGTGYQFRTHNPYMRREYLQMQSRGLQRSISQTVLEKEAEVQRNLYDAHAWLELGVKQQENEREGKAITALKRAIELDPTLLPAYLSLSTSYTNEGNRHDAYKILAQWVENNERYKIISAKYQLSAEEPGQFVSMRERKDRLVECLVEMATKAQEVGVQGMDADVQIALAVLLNTSEDYEKSLDCFKAALEARPDDWVLYNRVGATLANSGRPEEALAYYYRALEFNPSYIRARYNLGISCISLRRYEEAASYILDALVLQESDTTEDDARGVTSSSLWDILRTTCHHMSRRDLAELCEKHDLEGFRTTFQQ